MQISRSITRIAAVAVALGGGAAHADTGLADRCAALTGFRGDAASDPSVVVGIARMQVGTSVKAFFNPAPTPLVPHCEVIGKLQERRGIDGQTYAIKFHMRLPVDWNGGFVFEGGGGSNGNLGTAAGHIVGPRDNAVLNRGYAIVTQDSGHDNATNDVQARQGPVSFGHDFEARRNYAYASHEVVTRVAKAIVMTAYGKSPARSYFVGCSKGGQEGMMMAQRYPTYFDGILSGAPGFTLPKASAIGEAWDSQAMASAARALGQFDKAGVPLLNKAFSDADLALVSTAVLRACDMLDGVADGMNQAFGQCTTPVVAPALAALQCTGAKTPACLIPAQIDALKRLYDGARNAKGELLYATWPWDAGVGGRRADGKYYDGWRSWKIGTADGAANDAINVTLGAAAASAVFITPAAVVPMDPSALTDWALNFDLERDAWRIFHSSPDFPESAWDMMSAESTDRGAFRRHGGKLLIVHGVSDPIFSINDTVRWWKALNRAQGGTAAEFARVFAVPGMPHCSFGPATSDLDPFTALVDWVEKGRAPDRIVATAGPETPWPGRTRPLCPYPSQARYRGTGNIEDAANFTCQ